MKNKLYNIYAYDGLGDILEFAESQGWVEPDVDLERVDAADCIESDAIEYLTQKGWVISLHV
jgi:hypothetical protein